MTDTTNHAAMTKAELDRWYRDPGDLEVWEDIASWFHAETGHLRPGKDKAIGFHQCEEGEPDCCHGAWLEWRQEKARAGVQGLLTERVAQSERIKALEEALASINSIENKSYVGDWEEIDEARGIARAALATKEQQK